MSTDLASAVTLLDLHPATVDMRGEVLEGLRKEQKILSPKFFYDERGSRLFDQITEQPEYYPTRTEIGIMRANVAEMAKLIGPGASIIELGSGASVKVKILLDNLEDVAAYVPVDISKDFLVDAAQQIADEYTDLDVRPVCADFTEPFRLPVPNVMPRRNVVFFPGSTIGNFRPEFAQHLLEVMARVACEGGALLIGVDLKKDRAILERAYNDDAGVTARFNLNILTRINRDIGGNFDVSRFRHRAVYNEQLGRIEMHLVSQVAQTVTVGGEKIGFAEGEYILSETSHKYAVEQFIAMAADAEFASLRVWTDENKLFSVHLFECRAPYESDAV